MAYVPVVQSLSVRPTFIQVGPGVLWTGVTAPLDGAGANPLSSILMVSGQTSGVNDQRVYGPMLFTVSGTFIGSTIGDSTFSYRPTFVDIQTETSTAKVEKVLNTEEARCQFAVAELDAVNTNLAMPIGTLTRDIADQIQPNQRIDLVRVGGLRLVAPTCIAFVSGNRRINVEGPYSYVYCGYAAVSVDGFEAPFSRGRETVWRLSFELIAATSRTIGDQLFQFAFRHP